MAAPQLCVGDRVVFAKEKNSLSPGKRAKAVSPAAKGDLYSYVVEKYWRVKEVLDGNKVRLVTRQGKEHVVDMDDPRLRRANLWEKWVLRRRFPSANAAGSE